MSEAKLVQVPESLVGSRVDAGIAKMLGLSRNVIAELAEAGKICTDGKPLSKSDRLSIDQLVTVDLLAPKNRLQINAVEVDGFAVVFQDEHLVVVDKPAGVASHPSVGWQGPTVPGALLGLGIQLSTSGASERQGIVQRLDAGTSGLMVLAKSEVAYSRLKQAFRDRVVHKTYHALVQGHLDPSSGTFDAPIARHPKAEFKFHVAEGGKASVTHYDTLEMLRSASLVEVDLETGRTHQIRVHFAAFRHPLVGDTMYGADPALAAKLKLDRQWLHAMKLDFEHPVTGERVFFESSYPADLADALESLRNA